MAYSAACINGRTPPNFPAKPHRSDDLGYGEVGWTPGRTNTNISTPNIDALAKSGMAFINAYTGSPVCAPSRGTLMTGKHTGHSTIRGNHGEGGRDLPLAASDDTFLMALRKFGAPPQEARCGVSTH